MENKIIRFAGETRKESIINHLSLDIEQEYSFFEFLNEMGYDYNSDDELLISLHEMFIKL